MAARRILVILNPTAAQGQAAGREAEIRQLFEARGLNYELQLTKYVGHASELAKTAAENHFAVVVAAGGDGTVNETVNGLMAFAENQPNPPSLAVLCVGRGNDFAYGADIPTELGKAVDLITLDRPQPFDIGLVRGGDYPNGKYFANGLGIGFDTIVGLEARKMTVVHGFMAYVLGALKTLIIYPAAPTVRLSYQTTVIEQPSHQISIMNGKRMGGAFFMAPQALNHDGLLDLCMAGALTRARMVSLIVRYLKGSQASDPKITTGRSAHFLVEAPSGGLVVHADGETICLNGQRLEIDCLASKLLIHCARELG